MDKAKEYTHSTIDWLNNIKKSLKCKNCPEDRYWVLDFHHREPDKKDMEIARLIQMGSKKRILKEIEKCDIVCSNCHRDLHYQEKIKNAVVS